MIPTTDPMYQHFKISSDKELELTLDGVPIEYPALVKEAFLNNWHASAHQTDVPSNCASLNERHCWVMSRNQMFIWERAKSSHRATIPATLPLPTSGLPRTAKCVVVYDGAQMGGANKLPIPGVLIVSPEGVLRHWTSIESQNYIEKVLDINSEVALKVELIDEPADGKSASFLLTTTSGTIYFLNGEGAESGRTGALVCNKVCGREAQGFRRRLSAYLQGSKDVKESLVSNSFQFESKKGLLLVSVSPEALSVYNMLEPCELWTLKTKEFFQPKVHGFFEQDLKRVPNLVKTKLMDVAVFRDGLMCLLGGCHEDSATVSMFVIWLSADWQTKQPTDYVWSAKIPNTEHRALFAKNDPSVYTSMSLCIPKDTAEAKGAERTDGILVVHTFFAISLYLPFDLYKPKKHHALYRHVSFPAEDQLIGTAISKQYVYIIMLENGVSTIRLLPRGFSDGSILYNKTQIVVPSLAAGADDWGVLSEILSEMVAGGLPKTPVYASLSKAFELFAEKDMQKSAEQLKEIHNMADQELCRIVTQFLYAIIDYSDAANKTDTELHAKRVLTSRFHLFLKHMGLWDRIVVAPCAVMRAGVLTQRVGPTMLGEVSERVAATAAIWTWKCSNEGNAAIFDVIIEKVLRIPEVQDLGLKDKDALFGRCGLVHHIPFVGAQQLDKKILTKAKTHRMEIFHSVCEMLTGVRDSIFQWRKTKLAVTRLPFWWTIETFADCYRQVAERILEELREGQLSDSERTRMFHYIISIYDFFLSESDVRPDNDRILQELIALGKVGDAIELAERHKDFGTLIKNYLGTEIHTRQKTFERYKKTYETDDFEMYLCDYLKRTGRNDILMQQRGNRVDEYLDNFKELRFSREIANGQFGKAAFTLMSLAETEAKSFAKFSDFLTRAYYCATTAQLAGDQMDMTEVLDFYKRRYPEMKHRHRIPAEILKSGYGNDFDAMMSVEEMLEWNITFQPNDEATIQGFVRAFHLLADLLVVHLDSVELKEKIEKTWKTLIEYDEWARVRNKDDVETKTMFGRVCDWIVNEYPADKGDPYPAWMPVSRLVILPSTLDTILDESFSNPTSTNHHLAWIKGHIKWVAEQLGKFARLPRTAFFRPDTKEVGSIGQAVLEGFGPIFKAREDRFAEKLKAMSAKKDY